MSTFGDLRSPLAKARDKWKTSYEGLKCLDYQTLTAQQYLENRIELAFLAGARAQQEAFEKLLDTE